MQPFAVRRKKVLFVDDEPLVLQGLQRMLRGMRSEWEMEFVDGGSKALELMDQTSFDVVVSDMRMPGMNGAELLNTLAKDYPDTIRIILSGHADQDLISQCLGSAHQYLSKPCDPDLLKRLINETCRLGDEVASEHVRQVVGSLENLPSVPETYRRLSEALQHDEVSADDLGRIIAQDIGMTAKILKLVNSAFFGLRRELSNPEEAVTYLGTETVKSLVLIQGIFEEAKPLATRRIRLEDIWNHSLTVGERAKAVMGALHAPEQDEHDAFTAGVLHDLGVLILAQEMPETYDKVLELVARENNALSQAEQRMLGVNHAEVGAYLAGLWGLPSLIVASIRFHHTPAQSPGGLDRPSPVIAVHLADGFSSKLAPHQAFENAALDPLVLKAPWLAGSMEAVRALFPA